jgi:AcrR family transcriptional regulator
MGRKDLSDVRRNQILDAFEQCIWEFGLFHTTLTTVAEKAKINRGQIHQYIGNKDALLSALVARLIESYRENFSYYLEAFREKLDLDIVLEYFFNEWGRTEADDDVIFDALVAESAHNSHLKKLVFGAYSLLENELATVLHELHPNVSSDRCQIVAYAIISMAYGNSTMMWLGFDCSRLPEIRSLAKALLQTLET